MDNLGLKIRPTGRVLMERAVQRAVLFSLIRKCEGSGKKGISQKRRRRAKLGECGSPLTRNCKSQSGTSCRSPTFSNAQLVGWSQLQWEYLYHGNCKCYKSKLFFRVSCKIFTSTRLTKPWDRRQKSGITGKKYFKLRDAKYSKLLVLPQLKFPYVPNFQ